MTDVEIPSQPPVKRRQLEAADAKHLAVWASDESLAPSARKRAQEERARRKAANPDRVVGVVLDDGGATPEQIVVLRELLLSLAPSRIVHPYASGKLHTACRVSGAAVDVIGRARGMREVARQSDVLIGLVGVTSMPTAKVGVWDALRHGKDRGADVRIIWPNGDLKDGRW